MKTLYKNLKTVEGIKKNLLVEDGIIKRFTKALPRDEAEVVNCEGLWILPGFIDLHAHLREPGFEESEDIHSGLKAAAKGGFTTVVAMANTAPAVDNPELIEQNLNKAKDTGVKLIQASALTKAQEGKELVDIEAILPYTNVVTDDGKNLDNPEILVEALKETIKEPKLLFTVHEEPESEMIERDLKLLEEVGGKLHICHISREKSADLIREAKKKGLNVSCEVTPHHLYASCLGYKVNPPFGLSSDKKALIKALKDRTIDAIATDHAPHTKERKLKGAPGLVEFETAFGLVSTIFQNYNIPLSLIPELMSKNPAKLLGIKAGELRAGRPADFVLVDFDEEWCVNKKDFVSKSENTPFNGEWLKGRVHSTYKDGKLIYSIDQDDDR